MGKSYLVSIIVPIYNMEGTIKKCLDSIIHQTYRNIEIVAINDGSIDRSEEIVIDLAEKDSRIVLKSQENSGLAMSYYRGIEESRGEFILFVDSDDYIDEHMVEDLVNEQEHSGAEIVQSGVKRVYLNGNIMSCSHLEDKVYRDKTELYIAYFLTYNLNQTFAGNLIKRTLFKEITFEKGSLSTDLQVMPFLLEKCNYLQQVSKAYYYAILFPDSVSRGKMSDKVINDKFLCTKIWENFFENYAPDLCEIVPYRKVQVSMDVIFHLKKVSGVVNEERYIIKLCRNEFKKNYGIIKNSYINQYLSRKEKIKMWLFNVSPHLFFYIYSFYSSVFYNCQR